MASYRSKVTRPSGSSPLTPTYDDHTPHHVVVASCCHRNHFDVLHHRRDWLDCCSIDLHWTLYMSCKHQWVKMDWEEAYPASSGWKCITCNTTRLGWFVDLDKPPEQDPA